jgi:spermidine/putrescine transport system substrate-binding protein
MLKCFSLLVGIFLACSGCTRNVSFGPNSAIGDPNPKVVNLAIWSNYINPTLLETFEKKYGVKVQVSNYSSNEELLAKLQAGASGYDVAVPSDYMVYVMSKLGVLQKIDRNQLGNFKLVGSKYLKKSFDPENSYSVPYHWGTTGIAINKSLYKGNVKGWKTFFESADLGGRFSLLDDPRETIGAALKALGYSMNSKSPKELQEAKQLLLSARKKIKAFTSEPKMSLIHGELAVTHTYMVDAYQAKKEQPKSEIVYIIPEEGGTFWIDSLVVPKGAAHPKQAHQLIDFLLEAKASAQASLSLFSAPTVPTAIPLLPKAFTGNAGLFPADSILAKCEMLEDLGEAQVLWDRTWTEVKAAQD